MMKKLFGIAFALTFFILPAVVLAQQQVIQQTGSTYSPAQSGGTSVTVQNPLGASSFCGLIKALLNGALQIGIPIAVLFIVYAGFKFVLARGNSEKLVEARQNMLWTVVGIGIFLAAWLLAQLVFNTVNALGGNNPQSSISCS